MSYVHFCWFSTTRPQHPKPTALPKVSDLNNLSNWQHHLKSTEFLPVLWVNEEVYLEIQEYHLTGTLAKNSTIKSNSIDCLLECLPPKFDKEKDMLFWHARVRNNVYHAYTQSMGIVVINIEAYFKAIGHDIEYFKTILKLFQHILAAKLYAFLKDGTVDFLISYFGGAYFDLDIAPKLNVPFFESFNSLRELMSRDTLGNFLLRSYNIFPLVKHNDKAFELDVGAKFFIGKRRGINKFTVDQLDAIFSEENSHKFMEALSLYNQKIDNSGRKKLQLTTFECRKEWRNSYSKLDFPDFYEKLREEYPFQDTSKEVDELVFLHYYSNLIRLSIIGKTGEPLSLYNMSYLNDSVQLYDYYGWLYKYYWPVYVNFFQNKFVQVDPDFPSNYWYTGYELIEKEAKAEKKLKEGFKRFLSSVDSKEKLKAVLRDSIKK